MGGEEERDLKRVVVRDGKKGFMACYVRRHGRGFGGSVERGEEDAFGVWMAKQGNGSLILLMRSIHYGNCPHKICPLNYPIKL